MLPYTVHGAVWVILYLPFILAPLFAAMAGSLPPTRGHRRAPEGSAAGPAAENYLKPRPSFLNAASSAEEQEH
jgi:hypothetical protein